MPKTTTIEVWVVIDEDGDYAAGTTDEDAATKYRDEIGEPDLGTKGMRRVKVTLTIPLPEPIELAATVAAEKTATVAVA
jgi:hypothetical protein